MEEGAKGGFKRRVYKEGLQGGLNGRVQRRVYKEEV